MKRPSIHPARSLCATLALTLAVGACGDSGPSRADVVGTATDSVVPARYSAAAELAAAVVPAVDVWCDTGDAAAVNDAVAAARAAWVELRPFGFGPANEQRSMFVIDPRPRFDDVDALGAQGAAVDAESLRDLAGADQRGWGTVVHLAEGDATERRCEYASGAARLTADELDALAQEWTTYGPGLSESDAADVALRNIVSESIFAAQMVVDEPDPAFDDHRLAGIHMAVLGDGISNPGLTPLLSDGVVERLTAALDAGDAMTVQVILTTDVVGELGTTVNFSDADGDG